jgi:hypothetical protein
MYVNLVRGEKMNIPDFDQMLVGACEKFSHKVQRTTGITCFNLSNFFILFGLSLIGLVGYIHLKSVLTLVCSTVPFAIAFLGSVHHITKRCPPFRNPHEVTTIAKVVRLQMWIQMGFALLMLRGNHCWSVVLHMVMITIGFYFGSCTPLPPGESKVKKWVKGLKDAVSSAMEPRGEPQPV